jgi:hypothetical protein
MPPENQSTEQDTVFQRAASITGGILSAATRYLPHLIGACGIAIAGASFTINHTREQADTQTIWKHSGEWHSNQVVMAESISNLQVEIQQLQKNKK